MRITATVLLLLAVAGCGDRTPVGADTDPGTIGREIMESVALGLGEDLSDLRILAGSWEIIALDGRPELAAAIEAYAKGSGTAIKCPGGDPHYCWTGGSPWEEVHGKGPHPRTMPQVIDFGRPLMGLGSFPYRPTRRREDDPYSYPIRFFAIDAEQLENGDWRIGDLIDWGWGFGSW